MSEKMQGGEIRVENRFLRWLDNYWYHYKWHTVIGVFALIVVLICTLQMCTKEQTDVNILYAGSYSFVESGGAELSSAIGAVMPKDYNGDGRKQAGISSLYVLSEAQVKALRQELIEAGEENPFINSGYYAQELNKFYQLLQTGEYSICLMEAWIYESVRENGVFLPLAEALGSKPGEAYDDYTVRLSDTDFGRYFTGVADMPADTLIGFRRQGSLTSLMNRERAEKTYAQALETFRSIMNFEE